MQDVVKYEQEVGGIVLDPSQAPAPLPVAQEAENSSSSHHHHHHHHHRHGSKSHGGMIYQFTARCLIINIINLNFSW